MVNEDEIGRSIQINALGKQFPAPDEFDGVDECENFSQLGCEPWFCRTGIDDGGTVERYQN